MEGLHICSFSTPAAELPKRKRTAANVLLALNKNPRISTFDMSELPWLRDILSRLKNDGLITEDTAEPYPWHRFILIKHASAEKLSSQD